MSEKNLTIIASKGTLDWAYPPFILSSTAAALGYNVTMFFTFYGLQLLKKDLSLSVSPLGNPGMPMPMSMDKWFPVLGTTIPGMQTMMTGMMKNTIKSKGVASVAELRDLCLEADVKMIGCQMTIDLFDIKHEDLIDEIDLGGAATWLDQASDSDINLFIEAFKAQRLLIRARLRIPVRPGSPAPWGILPQAKQTQVVAMYLWPVPTVSP